MFTRINCPKQILSPLKFVPIILIFCVLVSSCSPGLGTVESSQTAVADVPTPAPTSASPTTETFSSDKLGLCFSYPAGYSQLPYNDTVEIVAPELPSSDLRGIFWFEISDAYDRTAETIADQDIALTGGLNIGRWTVTLGGEEALVLDGMPGQDLVRKVYIVHELKLYILSFSPTLSENVAASEQMEALYAAVTSSWAWSPCAAGK